MKGGEGVLEHFKSSLQQQADCWIHGHSCIMYEDTDSQGLVTDRK